MKESRLMCSVSHLFMMIFVLGLTSIVSAEVVNVSTDENVVGNTSIIEDLNITESETFEVLSSNANLIWETIGCMPKESTSNLIYDIIDVESRESIVQISVVLACSEDERVPHRFQCSFKWFHKNLSRKMELKQPHCLVFAITMT